MLSREKPIEYCFQKVKKYSQIVKDLEQKRQEVRSQEIEVWNEEAVACLSLFLGKVERKQIVEFLYKGLDFCHQKQSFVEEEYNDSLSDTPWEFAIKTLHSPEEVKHEQEEEACFWQIEQAKEILKTLFNENKQARKYFHWLYVCHKIDKALYCADSKLQESTIYVTAVLYKEITYMLQKVVCLNSSYWSDRKTGLTKSKRIVFMDTQIQRLTNLTTCFLKDGCFDKKNIHTYVLYMEMIMRDTCDVYIQKQQQDREKKEGILGFGYFTPQATHVDVIQFTNLFIEMYQELQDYCKGLKDEFDWETFAQEFDRFSPISSPDSPLMWL